MASNDLIAPDYRYSRVDRPLPTFVHAYPEAPSPFFT